MTRKNAYIKTFAMFNKKLAISKKLYMMGKYFIVISVIKIAKIFKENRKLQLVLLFHIKDA